MEIKEILSRKHFSGLKNHNISEPGRGHCWISYYVVPKFQPLLLFIYFLFTFYYLKPS